MTYVPLASSSIILCWPKGGYARQRDLAKVTGCISIMARKYLKHDLTVTLALGFIIREKWQLSSH